jgi:hypothetical protein
MMNCSTGAADINDPTVAKVCQMARGWGFAGALIGNACAYRATNKMRLLDVADPVGPRNHAALLEMAAEAGLIVIAHGRLPGDLQVHANAMCRLLEDAGHRLHVLRLTDDGVPMHPLARGRRHIPVTTKPFPWRFSESPRA